MLSIGTVVMGVDDLHRAAAFWTRAPGYVPKRPLRPEDDFMILTAERGTAPIWHST